MREIMFRGLSIEEGVTTSKWFYGDYISQPEWEEIVYYDKSKTIIDSIHQKVDPKTVGQFTGLKDKNDKEIFVGDLVKHSKLGNFEISFHEGAYRMGIILLCFYAKEVEVIGNIYETSTTS